MDHPPYAGNDSVSYLRLNICTTGKRHIFREVNPEANSDSAFKRGVPMAGGDANLVEQVDVPEDIKIKAMEKLIPASKHPPNSFHLKTQPDFHRIMPLANPKGVKKLCEMCSAPGHLACSVCGVTFYCSDLHQQQDKLHQNLCLKLLIIRGQADISAQSLARHQSLAHKNLITISLLEEVFCNAVENLYAGNTENAIAQFRLCLPIFPKTYKLSSCEAVTLFSFMSESFLNQELNELARNSLAMATVKLRKLESRNPNTPVIYTKSLLFKVQGRLDLVEGRYKDAVFQFAECVYHSAEVFGPDHVRVCVGYYYLGKAFIASNRKSEGLGLLEFCADMWMAYVEGIFLEHISKEVDVQKKIFFTTTVNFDAAMERFLQLEAYQHLKGIEVVFSSQEHDPEVLAKATISLGILDFFNSNYSEARQRAELALEFESLNESSNPKLRQLAKQLRRFSVRHLNIKRRAQRSM